MRPRNGVTGLPTRPGRTIASKPSSRRRATTIAAVAALTEVEITDGTVTWQTWQTWRVRLIAPTARNVRRTDRARIAASNFIKLEE